MENAPGRRTTMINNERRRRERGTALLEFSLAVVTILLVLFGIIDLGRAAFAYDWVSDSARQATRWAMVRGAQCSGLSGGCPATKNDITNYVKSLATGIDPSQVTVDSQCIGATVSDPPCATGTATTPAYIRVTVHYNFI